MSQKIFNTYFFKASVFCEMYILSKQIFNIECCKHILPENSKTFSFVCVVAESVQHPGWLFVWKVNSKTGNGWQQESKRSKCFKQTFLKRYNARKTPKRNMGHKIRITNDMCLFSVEFLKRAHWKTFSERCSTELSLIMTLSTYFQQWWWHAATNLECNFV